MEIKEILEELGYKIKNHGNYYRTSALYRSGDNPGALVIYHRDDKVIDMVTGERFNVEALIQRTLNIPLENVKEWLGGRQIIVPKIDRAEIKMDKTFDEIELIPDYTYWNKRGIKNDILIKLKSGVSLAGDMKNRYVFNIFNNKKEIIGKAGRDLTGNSHAKWKIVGSKTNFVWPAFHNVSEIKEKKEIILVESIGCYLSLVEAGINHGIVLFGTEISQKIINFCIAVGAQSIIVATNNDAQFRDSNAGNKAAEKIKKRLDLYFDEGVTKIKLPNKDKDFNEQLLNHGRESIIEWYHE